MFFCLLSSSSAPCYVFFPYEQTKKFSSARGSASNFSRPCGRGADTHARQATRSRRQLMLQSRRPRQRRLMLQWAVRVRPTAPRHAKPSPAPHSSPTRAVAAAKAPRETPDSVSGARAHDARRDVPLKGATPARPWWLPHPVSNVTHKHTAQPTRALVLQAPHAHIRVGGCHTP
jgi:hypothetical protein